MTHQVLMTTVQNASFPTCRPVGAPRAATSRHEPPVPCSPCRKPTQAPFTRDVAPRHIAQQLLLITVQNASFVGRLHGDGPALPTTLDDYCSTCFTCRPQPVMITVQNASFVGRLHGDGPALGPALAPMVLPWRPWRHRGLAPHRSTLLICRETHLQTQQHAPHLSGDSSPNSANTSPSSCSKPTPV